MHQVFLVATRRKVRYLEGGPSILPFERTCPNNQFLAQPWHRRACHRQPVSYNLQHSMNTMYLITEYVHYSVVKVLELASEPVLSIFLHLIIPWALAVARVHAHALCRSSFFLYRIVCPSYLLWHRVLLPSTLLSPTAECSVLLLLLQRALVRCHAYGAHS